MLLLIKGSKIKCSFCGTEQEDFVEDYVIVGRVGVESEAEEECCNCGRIFSVYLADDGKFIVKQN